MIDQRLIKLTTRITSAFVGSNRVPAKELPAFIENVANAVENAFASASPQPQADPVMLGRIKDEVTADGIKCRLCGERFMILRRHLNSTHGTSTDEYKKQFKLPADFKFVAASVSKRRSEIMRATRQKRGR